MQERVSGAQPAASDVTLEASTARATLAPSASSRPSRLAALGRKVRAYVALTKPRIIELLLVTTIPTMVLAAGGLPPLGLVLATLVGGAAAAGAANTLNCVLDRDIDGVMNRTRRRPLVTGEATTREASVLGYSLAAASVLWFGLLVNWAAAGLTLVAILLYVVGYTILLKRRTSQNIVWGGAAGCMPVLIGWSAVTGGLAWPALVLFAVIFFWTPPHYWPLSMKFRRDYAAAGVPMLPVVAEDAVVARKMIGYAVAMVASTLVLVPVAGMTWFYGAAALALGAWFTALCVRLWRRARRGVHRSADAMQVFHASITYLTLLFVAVAVDPFLPF